MSNILNDIENELNRVVAPQITELIQITLKKKKAYKTGRLYGSIEVKFVGTEFDIYALEYWNEVNEAKQIMESVLKSSQYKAIEKQIDNIIYKNLDK